MKYLILGGGPAGLTFANKLIEKGENDFLLLEKESVAGGLCRSIDVDGSPLDIGGGHFLDVKRKAVNDFIFSFLPETEWNVYERDSQIEINDCLVSHPLEANIWQMDINSQVEYLKSIAIAGCNIGNDKPEKFVDWIIWKLGKKIADDYMLPYNSKMFGNELNNLGTYWLEKLPNVSFEETLLSCLEKKAYGKQPGHAQFYYPKHYGYGEVWCRMAERLGNKIKYNTICKKIDLQKKEVKDQNGNIYSADVIITTIPWTSFEKIDGLPNHLTDSIDRLKHTSVEIKYYENNLDSKAHWIYYPDEKKSYHRILLRQNFCEGSKGYWTETNKERIDEHDDRYSYMNEYAYPLNTIDKPVIMKDLIEFCNNQCVYPLGRWGEHQHYNSDVTVEKAMNLAERLL